MEGHRRPGQDPPRRPARLNRHLRRLLGRRNADLLTGAVRTSFEAGRRGLSDVVTLGIFVGARLMPLVERARGPWRVAVAEGSMRPAIASGDWLLVDPTVRRWPRAGTVVIVREPETDVLAIKRVAVGPGGIVRNVPVTDPETGEDRIVAVRLGPHEAWLLGDAADGSIDSRAYGPLGRDRLVARAWFRYAPLGRAGLLRR